MPELTQDQIIDHLSHMTVLELAERYANLTVNWIVL